MIRILEICAGLLVLLILSAFIIVATAWKYKIQNDKKK